MDGTSLTGGFAKKEQLNLIRELKGMISKDNLDTLSMKKIMKALKEKFGAEVKERKPWISEQVSAIVAKVSAGEEPFPGAGSSKPKAAAAKKPAAAKADDKPAAAAKAEEKPAAAEKKEPAAETTEKPDPAPAKAAAVEKKAPAKDPAAAAAAPFGAAGGAADDGSTPVIEGVALEGLWMSSVGGAMLVCKGKHTHQ